MRENELIYSLNKKENWYRLSIEDSFSESKSFIRGFVISKKSEQIVQWANKGFFNASPINYSYIFSLLKKTRSELHSTFCPFCPLTISLLSAITTVHNVLGAGGIKDRTIWMAGEMFFLASAPKEAPYRHKNEEKRILWWDKYRRRKDILRTGKGGFAGGFQKLQAGKDGRIWNYVCASKWKKKSFTRPIF